MLMLKKWVITLAHDILPLSITYATSKRRNMVSVDGAHNSVLLESRSDFIGQGRENRNQMIRGPGPNAH